MPPYRIGLIVPSSNTTIETEVPQMLGARERIAPERFTFHSSRMRMRNVTREELAAMNREADRCAGELADARVHAINYACLVAIMSVEPGFHRTAEAQVRAAAGAQSGAPVITSAGALVHGLHTIGAKRVAIITPYIRSLTAMMEAYLAAEGIEVVDSISLEIADNAAVGSLEPMDLVSIADRLDASNADAVVLSACVQMPSLPAISIVEQRKNLPVVTAAACTVFQTLQALGLNTEVPGAGALLSGRY